MNRLTLSLCVSLTVIGCQSNPGGVTPDPSPAPIRAVYLIQPPGELLQSDLQAHPEVVVATSFSEFKQRAQTKVSLWIDKNATRLITDDWLAQPPQRDYPLVLIGYSQVWIAFRGLPGVCCFTGPVMTGTPIPGYSIFQREFSVNNPHPRAYFLNGYTQPPTVQDILNVTNALLDSKLTPTPTPAAPAWITPTPLPTPTPAP